MWNMLLWLHDKPRLVQRPSEVHGLMCKPAAASQK